MRVRTPPLQVSSQVWDLLSRRPASTSQRGYCMADRQTHPFDKGGVEPSREAQSV